jgi:transglutaminase-like putative cysteine protease
MLTPSERQDYLAVSDAIDWQDPRILELADRLAAGCDSELAIAQACFEWVRDQIHHSFDYQQNPVTWRASDVLHHGTGYCYAKSHLLGALLRAKGIPVGFCYQRLSINDSGAPYCLHGLNGIYLTEFGWYRVDARGNREGVNAQFVPPQEQLAFPIQCDDEVDFLGVLAEPLPIVIQSLQAQTTWDGMLADLPDMAIGDWKFPVRNTP